MAMLGMKYDRSVWWRESMRMAGDSDGGMVLA